MRQQKNKFSLFFVLYFSWWCECNFCFSIVVVLKVQNNKVMKFYEYNSWMLWFNFNYLIGTAVGIWFLKMNQRETQLNSHFLSEKSRREKIPRKNFPFGLRFKVSWALIQFLLSDILEYIVNFLSQELLLF